MKIDLNRIFETPQPISTFEPEDYEEIQERVRSILNHSDSSDATQRNPNEPDSGQTSSKKV